jgi:hypothetical protein
VIKGFQERVVENLVTVVPMMQQLLIGCQAKLDPYPIHRYVVEDIPLHGSQRIIRKLPHTCPPQVDFQERG